MVNLHYAGMYLGTGGCAAVCRDAGLALAGLAWVAEHSLRDSAHLVTNIWPLRAGGTESVSTGLSGDAEAVAFKEHGLNRGGDCAVGAGGDQLRIGGQDCELYRVGMRHTFRCLLDEVGGPGGAEGIGTRARGGELCWNDGGIGDECRYFSSIGAYQQLFGRGNLRDATFLQHHDAVCDGEGFIAIMGDVDCGKRSEERRVGKECRSRWSPYH